jgi:hypothetical protein
VGDFTDHGMSACTYAGISDTPRSDATKDMTIAGLSAPCVGAICMASITVRSRRVFQAALESSLPGQIHCAGIVVTFLRFVGNNSNASQVPSSWHAHGFSTNVRTEVSRSRMGSSFQESHNNF